MKISKAALAGHLTKKQRNDKNIKQVIDVLVAANYRAGRTIRSGQGHVEFWVGPGRVPVVALL